MKPYVVNTHTKFIFILALPPRLIFGTGIFSPIIHNYGNYKEVSSSPNLSLQPLVGHVPPDINNATKLSAVEADQILSLSIVLPLNFEDELDQKLLDLSNPRSPSYRQFLSQDEFIARYAPTEEEKNAVQAYLEDNGFQVLAVDPNRLIMHVTGDIATINRVFNTEIFYFRDALGKQFYAPLYEIQVDSSLKIHSVHGLENRFHAHPHHKLLDAKNARKGLAPADIKKAYSLTSSLDGTGQVLAVFELEGFSESDIRAYEDAYNLPHVPITSISVDNAHGAPGAESTLDIELMIALAPKASKILVYEGPNSGSGVLDTYNKIATDNLAKSISTSWGATETSNPGSFIRAESLIFKQMIAQGQSLYAAAGDSGAYDDDTNLSVDDPASQSLIVAVGGTKLSTKSDGSYKSETTWSSGNGPGNSGGGGGISTIWTIPSWQQGVARANAGASTTMRNLPDIALDSDPSTGYAIYFGGKWKVYGGTSCAAPLWAALTALVNQQLATQGQNALGFPNPSLYQLGQSQNYGVSFNDVSDGSTNGYYQAVSGFDLATGWGTFKGDGLISNLAGIKPPVPSCIRANPTISITPNSQEGKPGDTLGYSIHVTNNDSSLCGVSDFNLSSSLPNAFSANLAPAITINPQESADSSVSVASEHTVAAGNYDFSISVQNAQDANFVGTASARYIVKQDQDLTLSINPLDGTSFKRSDFPIAHFEVNLSNSGTPIPKQKVNMRVDGPQSWKRQSKTNQHGTFQFLVFISPVLPAGNYQITASSEYKGKTVTEHITFNLQ